MTDLIKYWPSKEEVSAVCGFQAEFMEEHILLSIHRKLKFDYINRIDPSRSEEKDEEKEDASECSVSEVYQARCVI